MKTETQRTEKVGFKRDLRAMDIWGLALGAMIGWGCFVLPGNSFLPKAGPWGMAVGMLVGALLIMVISISFSYLISKFPVSGGEFVYADAAFGKVHAFICGWFIVLAYWCLIPLNGTAVGLIGRYLFPGILQQGLMYTVAGWEVFAGEVAVAILAIVIMGLANMRGVKIAGWIQSTVALTLVGSILLVTGAVLWNGANWGNLQPGIPVGKTPFSAIFAIAAMAPWAFIGFDCIPQAAEEYRFSNKKTLFILISSICVATLMYICINTVTAIVMPWQELIDSKPFWATGLAVEMVLGKFGLFCIGVAMFCAVISGLNAFFLSASRLMYAMSNADALPAWFGKLDPVHHVPRNAIWFIMALAIFAPFFGREVLNWIVDMTSVGAALAYGYTTASAMVLAKRNGDTRYMIAGIFGTVFSVFFLGLLLIPGAPGFLSIQAQLALLVWVVLGIIFYWRIRKKYLKSTKMREMIEEVCADCAMENS